MAIPIDSGEKQLIRLLRGELPPLTRPASPGRREIAPHPPVDETVISTALETVADDSTGGGIPGVLSGRIDQSLPDFTLTAIVLGAAASINRAVIDYHCERSTSTEWGQVDVVLLQNGSTVECVPDQSWPGGESGCGLTFTGDVSGGNLRLKIQTTSTGSSADFRATFRTVPA